MFEVALTMKGDRQLVVKSDRGVNPLDPNVRELKKFTGKKTKTEEDHEIISRLEFELGLYWSQTTGPYIPTGNVHKALVEGARLSKRGKQVEQGCIPLADRVPILYEGPRGVQELCADPNHMYKVSVGIAKKRTMRTRPRFMPWALEVPLVIDPDKLDLDVFIEIAEVTGKYIGIGERRPMFGAFTPHVEITKEANTNGHHAHAISAS